MVTEGSKIRLVRSDHNKVFAGVCGGLAQHLNVDPIVVRIAFVVLAFINGVGFAAYLAAWLLVPKETEAQSVAEGAIERVRGRQSENDKTWAWVLVAGIAAIIIIATNPTVGFDGGGMIWALALIGGGIWMYMQDMESRNENTVNPTVPVEGPLPASGAPISTSAVTAQAVRTPAKTIPQPVVRPLQPRIVRTPRPVSHLGRYTFALILVIVGSAAALDNVGAISLSPPQYGGLVLSTIGGGLLIGTFWGRSRFLIFLGLVTVPIVFATSLLTSWIDVPWDSGMGEPIYIPINASAINRPYELVAGQMNIDLTQLNWGAEPVLVEASVGFGNMSVTVPEGVSVEARTNVDLGGIRLFDDRREGTGINLSSDEEVLGQPRLVLDLHTFMGEIDVNRSSATANVGAAAAANQEEG